MALTVEDLFNQLPGRLRPDAAAGSRCDLQWNLTDLDPGVWQSSQGRSGRAHTWRCADAGYDLHHDERCVAGCVRGPPGGDECFHDGQAQG
jgi:hypothetical protein